MFVFDVNAYCNKIAIPLWKKIVGVMHLCFSFLLFIYSAMLCPPTFKSSNYALMLKLYP
uniref:Uncharacterized protein n=1 Tax=Arundo donax TaxID=35708 RepID=A0A0A9H6Z2_ARUDO